ncbi:E3 ubiquitin-protein ligase MARCHF6-like isoform X2 [Tachypleus tridentatus]|uniref:E3 ubiquitin-protein ligase MARCHF6-like isoform X2 n=1 Tax=Tachypleus tridentatus TaxID=6853 RepID=UPI003FD29643
MEHDGNDYDGEEDICRMCRSAGNIESPLYYPCICRGSMKYVHQECLQTWLKFSKNEFCEVCTHCFSFVPIYSSDMPPKCSLKYFFSATKTLTFRMLKWFFVLHLWIGILPLCIARISTFMFNGSFNTALLLLMELVKTGNVLTDILIGWGIILCVLIGFFSLVCLQVCIDSEGGPEWLKTGEDNFLYNMDSFEDVIDMNNEDTLEINYNQNFNQNSVHSYGENHEMEERSWSEILGFEGTSYFPRNVIWALTLLTGVIFIFALCPVVCGQYIFTIFQLKEIVSAFILSPFEEILSVLSGYVALGFILIIFYQMSLLFRFFFASWCIGLCYLGLKIFHLIVLEAVFFPVFCGIWLDFCSLSVTGRTSQDIKNSFKSSPKLSVLVYWMVGVTMVYIFSSFIVLLRDILQQKSCRFLPSLYDLEFSAVHNFIMSSVFQEVKEVLVFFTLYMAVTWLMICFPAWSITKYLPTVLPFCIPLSSEEIVNELSLEIVILQVFLPLMFDKNLFYQLFKSFISGWIFNVLYHLGIHLCFSGTRVIYKQKNKEQCNESFHIEEQMLVHSDEQTPEKVLPGNCNSESPSFIALRVFLFLVLASLSMSISGFLILVIPVLLGRIIFDKFLGKPTAHDGYTIICGFFVLWMGLRLVNFMYKGYQKTWQSNVVNTVKSWLIIILKSLIGIFLVLGILPLLLGLFSDLVFIIPFQLPDSETPVFYLFQDWIIGVLQIKLLTAIILTRPGWWLTHIASQVCSLGFSRISLRILCINLVLPVVLALSLALALPFLISTSLVILFELSYETRNRILRKFYPVVLGTAAVFLGMNYLLRRLSRLYEKYWDEKYVIGHCLVNCVPDDGNPLHQQKSKKI